MKKWWVAGVMVLMIILSEKADSQEQGVSYQVFYDELSPYGLWVNASPYGIVWVPREAGDFRPYGSRGRWLMTEYGNTWVSDDPWGWACYHYGRWTYDTYYGWIWIPGTEWAPAWVSWRMGAGYCGWAPMEPGATLGPGYDCPESWWMFTETQFMYLPGCIDRWKGPAANGAIIRQTTFVNNCYIDNATHVQYNYGPNAATIQDMSGQRVKIYHLATIARPGAMATGGNSVTMYRPAINKRTAIYARPANLLPAPRTVSEPKPALITAPEHEPEFRTMMRRTNPGLNEGLKPHESGRHIDSPGKRRHTTF